ncbi:hypothetical protein SLA2020_525070 [Shorea laevis]
MASGNFDDASRLFNFVVQDGNGIRGLVDLGLTEVPKPYIQPPQEQIDESSHHLQHQPPIDLSLLDGPDRDRVAQQVVSAAETLGFFQVVNHGLPSELLESLKESAHAFFGQPPEKKAVYRKDDYISMKYTNDTDALQYWPNECRKVALEYVKTSTNMVRKLMEILIGHLGAKLDDSMIDALIGSKMVNMNFYPSCPNPKLTVGVGRHSDMGTLTVLLQDGIGGLYVKVEEDVDFATKGEWVEIPPLPGALVINVGDTLQILSNGKYKSAEHRVRTTSASSRVSIPVFTMPKLSVKVAPLPEMIEKDGMARYREVVFADYMKTFFGNAHEGKKSLDFAGIKV